MILYSQVINNTMNEHYDKYKETIKKVVRVVRRHRLLKDKWIEQII